MGGPGAQAHGAYGLALPGVAGERARHLAPAPKSWEAWELERHDWADGRIEREWLWPRRARLRVSGGGWVEIDGAARHASLHVPPGTADHAFVHPYLSMVAAMAAYWRGWHYLHAGAVVVDGGVWGVFGQRGAGKSSTLAHLSLREGIDILCDDVLVMDGDLVAYAGPRCVDLRGDAAERLGLGEDLGVVGGRRRWRMALDSVAPELPFRGWVELAWAGDVAVADPAPTERFEALARNLAVRLVPPDAAALLRLADQPYMRFSRPRDYEQLDGALDQLVAVLRR
ncbi:MAG TPA: hypothetical protein VEX39_18420 [Thermoleophilaceae bacterium]|nr:hypothetical protein [Thermoleophilaceae bacterium]